jgi:Ran GTPase-activating protein (RanGAP) involved in mRNA processing and transport
MIGDVGAASLSEALKDNAGVRSLWLSRNEIGDLGATSLAAALAVNTRLLLLDLSVNLIGRVGATAIANALHGPHCQSVLLTLDLSHNKICSEAAISIAMALRENHTLTTVTLNACGIDAAGGTALCGALEVNKTLLHLALRDNRVSSHAAFAKTLRVNNTLEELDLHANWRGVAEVPSEGFWLALQDNTGLRTLTLSHCAINDDSVHHLADALEVNTTLTSLHLGRTS